MSRAVMLSIRPKWCEMIASGNKTIEVRKTAPKIETPFKCYIYCTKPKFDHEDFLVFDDEQGKARGCHCGGLVVGEFVCDKILDILISCSDPNMKGYPFPCTGLTDREIMDYLGNGKSGFGWHISDLVIYERPKYLTEFIGLTQTRFGYAERLLTAPPQSFYYVEELL